MPRAAALKLPKFPDCVWSEIAREYPRGCNFRYDAVSATRKIVSVLRSLLARADGSFVIDLDQDDGEDEPKNIVVAHGERTSLIALRFRKKIVTVGGDPVAVARDDGIVHLARAIVSKIFRGPVTNRKRFVAERGRPRATPIF